MWMATAHGSFQQVNLRQVNGILILGDPGAASRDDAINIFGRKFTSGAEEPLGTYSYRTSSRSDRIPSR